MEPENRAQPTPRPPAQRPDDPSASGRPDRPRSEGELHRERGPHSGHAGGIGLRSERGSDSTTDPAEPIRTTGRPSSPRRATRAIPTPAIPSRDGTSRATPSRDTTSRDTDTGATASLATTSPAIRRPAMAVIRQRATDDRDTASSPAIRARTTASPVMASGLRRWAIPPPSYGQQDYPHAGVRAGGLSPRRAMGSSPMANRTTRPRATRQSGYAIRRLRRSGGQLPAAGLPDGLSAGLPRDRGTGRRADPAQIASSERG